MKSHFDARSELLTIVLLEVLCCVCLLGGTICGMGFVFVFVFLQLQGVTKVGRK